MIELILADRCIGCDACVEACPDDVLRPGVDGVPVALNRDDCQTCYLCELFCPVDALYVSPRTVPDPGVNAEALLAAGLIGSYRKELGWKNGRPGGTATDMSYRMHEAFPAPLGEAWKRSGL